MRLFDFLHNRRYDGDIDGLIYRIEIDQRLSAVAAGLKVAFLILLVISR